MQPQPPGLVIGYGAAYTRAVLVWPGGVWTVVGFDGGVELSSAVHAGAGAVLVGAAAWRQAETDPDGFVLAPLRAGTGRVTVGGVDMDVVELVAATLRHVAAEAARVAGTAPTDVRMVVPAGWGPRRRTWLRHAARTAGLGQPRLVEAPVAAATRLTSDAVLAEQSTLLVIDVGAGCEVSVLRRGPAGFEVLSTLADADAGGDRIDALLATAVGGVDVAELPGGRRWPLLASVRAAKQALSEQVAVTMPMPGGDPPMVVNTAVLRQCLVPVLDRVGAVAAETVANADLTVTDLDAVYAVGAAASMPDAADLIAAKLGAVPQIAVQPGVVAVLGAAGAAGSPDRVGAEGTVTGRVPPLRRLAGLCLPGLVSLLLYGQFVFTAEFNNGTPTSPGQYYYVLASWGELAMAAVFALVTFLRAGALLAAIVDEQGQPGPLRPGGPEGRITAGIGVAVLAGWAVAGLYAVTAAVYFAQPVAGALRWAVLPILPTMVAAAVLAVIAGRRHTTPAGGWDTFLAFPTSATAAAGAGTIALVWWWTGQLPVWLSGWADTLGYAGGLLIGVGVAGTLVNHVVGRIVLGLLLGFFCLIISRAGPGIPAVAYALAVAVWWSHRAWAVARIRQTMHPAPPPGIG